MPPAMRYRECTEGELSMTTQTQPHFLRVRSSHRWWTLTPLTLMLWGYGLSTITLPTQTWAKEASSPSASSAEQL